MQKGTLIGTEQRLGHFAYLLEESAFKQVPLSPTSAVPYVF
jgi:hypothetical protein